MAPSQIFDVRSQPINFFYSELVSVIAFSTETIGCAQNLKMIQQGFRAYASLIKLVIWIVIFYQIAELQYWEGQDYPQRVLSLR